MRHVLYAVMCAAPPVHHVRRLVSAAHARDFDVCVILTPTAADWLADSRAELEELTGHPVRSAYKRPADPDVLPQAHAVLVAPASFNTINKWAAGISDTLALGLINEAIGLEIPVLAVPHSKGALQAHPAYRRSLAALEDAGVELLLPDAAVTSQTFPWERALDRVSRRLR
ncbi:flavoprotein [Actinocorallia populi]|uniref:flavoprotein n=1 Tax=Actinocorallia populi TaxID=2079200 RepID=UPI000D08E1DA|nr:flavoprotein [Actinocorallia populi]